MSDLYRVLSGETAHKYLIVKSPELDDLAKANAYYSEVFDYNFERGVYTTDELCEDVSEQQDCISKRLESLKVEYYKIIVGTYSDDPSRFFTLKRIEETEEELQSLTMDNRRLEHLSCEGIAYLAKAYFLLERTTLWSTDRRPYDWSLASIDQVHDWYCNQKLSERQIREIAKSSEWRQIWNIKSFGSIFSRPLYLLSEEQKNLLFWSNMYDSANESQDRPSDEVLKDDHAFDGWLIERHKENAREVSQASREKFSKAQQAQDVFLQVHSPKDLEVIQSLNSPEAMGRKMTMFRRMNDDAKAQRET